MENLLDPYEEIIKLQDKVRKLENQLRAPQMTQNYDGFEIRNNILPSLIDLECGKNQPDHYIISDDELMKPEELQWENFEDPETWLYQCKNDSIVPKNLSKWLRKDVDNQSDHEMQSIRRILSDKLDEIERGQQKRFINTQTYTRPKKRTSPRRLGIMSQNSVFENHQELDTSWNRVLPKQVFEKIDDKRMNFSLNLLSLNNPRFSSTSCNDDVDLRQNFVNVEREMGSFVSSTPKNTMFKKKNCDNNVPETSDSNRSFTRRVLQNSLFENNRSLDSPWKRIVSKQMTDMIDDESMNFCSSLLSYNGSSLSAISDKKEMEFNTTTTKDQIDCNTTFVKDYSEMETFVSTPKNDTSKKMENENCGSDSNKSFNLEEGSVLDLNLTFDRGSNVSTSPLHTSGVKNTSLNCTYGLAENQERFLFSGSGEEDDRLSSASDSSFSSTTLLKNLGDVQNIARLQEENLKLVTSSPRRRSNREAAEDTFSPIRHVQGNEHQGYLSDRSDHSSIDGRARSSKSSLRSSPSVSPYGSTHALASDYQQLPLSTVQRLETKQPKLPASKSASAGKSAGGGQRLMSGLRPPTVRPGTGSHPSTLTTSSIPRPASRIPGPRRSVLPRTKATPQCNGMDDCY